MRAYLAYLRATMRLTLRDRLVLFFNYLFPLIFFIGFGEMMDAGKGRGAAVQVLSMVLVIGILGTGFFGAGIRATLEREAGILRRFKVAPITPAPSLISSIVTGWAVFMPAAAAFVAIGMARYGMPLPENPISLLVVLTLGIAAFRSLGLIIASVVNSMQESQVLIQLLYLPMLMLSGATIPLTMLPEWLQVAAQFLPATHLYLGMQAVLVRGESALGNWQALGALAATSAIALFISMKLFRWEKEEKLKPAAKLWVAAALAPFVIAGVWQMKSRENLREAKALAREMRRSVTWLIRDARIFTGEEVIERGGVLIRNGRIEKIYRGGTPEAQSVSAESIDAAGKTVLPGLIDAQVVLALNGGLPPKSPEDLRANARRALAAYLYCGVVAVGAAGMAPELGTLAEEIRRGESLGAEVLPAPERGGQARLMRLVTAEAARQMEAGRLDLLSGTLVEQVTPRAVLESIRQAAGEHKGAAPPAAGRGAGMAVVATLSGILPLPHGPMIHRELQLLVREGETPENALKAATVHAAQWLGVSNRLGSIRTGLEASLLIVEGDPLSDIAATERIWMVMLKGERVARSALLKPGGAGL
jgi:imidazolonepropionase-like amidohydrolase/ABC-type multidrug transport system permease subunit